jgi:hypothetical protein
MRRSDKRILRRKVGFKNSFFINNNDKFYPLDFLSLVTVNGIQCNTQFHI